MMFKRVITFSNVIPEAREAWKTFFRFSLAELAIWNPVIFLYRNWIPDNNKT